MKTCPHLQNVRLVRDESILIDAADAEISRPQRIVRLYIPWPDTLFETQWSPFRLDPSHQRRHFIGNMNIINTVGDMTARLTFCPLTTARLGPKSFCIYKNFKTEIDQGLIAMQCPSIVG